MKTDEIIGWLECLAQRYEGMHGESIESYRQAAENDAAMSAAMLGRADALEEADADIRRLIRRIREG